jgi:hypothetical protein
MPRRSTVDEAATDLYALSPREFTAHRDTLAKAAKASGDKDGAREIAALRKPTVTAWLANQLVRRRHDDVVALLDLGPALRDATATLSGPQLRELSRQRNQVVQALVRQARRLAADAEQPVSEEVARGLETTLNAALADEAAATVLLQGRLAAQLEHSGFGLPSDAPPAPQVTTPPSRTSDRRGKEPTAAERRRQERRKQLEEELAEAWGAARDAADVRVLADDRATAAGKAADQAQREVERIRAQLTEMEESLAAAVAEREAADTEFTTARAAADQATARVSTLQRRLEKD